MKMKKTLIITSAAFLLFFSCTKTEKQISESSVKPHSLAVSTPIFAIDSVKVNDSLKVDENLTTAFQSKVLVFPNISNKTVLDSVYSPMNIKLESYSKDQILEALEKQKTDFFQNSKENITEWKPDFEQTWDQTSDMKLFSKMDDFITIQYTASGYTGGAHGYYNEIYKVFDLKTNKSLQLSDILKVQDAEIWSRILMDHFLKNDLEKGQAAALLVKEIPLNNNFYFDKEYLYFLYNQYEIAAYAAGPVLIKIPLSEIKPFLNDEFKTKLKL